MASHSDLDLAGTSVEETARDFVALLGKFPYQPTLYLGLGGTGAQCVQKIKSLFLQHVTPQAKKHQKAGVPDIDKLYSFLAFDTNRAERPSGLAENKEWFHLPVRDLQKFYQKAAKTAFFEDWLVKGFPAGSVMAGAGGFRNIGRLALIVNIADVSKALDRARDQILGAATSVRTSNPRPRVFVFCSLSGGTGSGMVLDMSFLLRNAFDDAELVGILGVLDGLPSLPQTKRSDLRVNTFCGFKELHAFMTGTATGFESGSTIEYPFGARGVVREPFDECHLVSSHRDDGPHNLPTQPHLTSFMARCAFMMSAYSFSGKGLTTPDYAGVMVNHRDRLTGTWAGTRTCYVVPGLAQVHFPVSTVANLFVIQAAKEYLRYQSGGNAPAGEDEARAFAAQHRLDFRSVQSRIGANPNDPRGRTLVARSYDDDVRALMSTKAKVRDENRHEILSFGRRLPHARLADLFTLLQPNIDAAVEAVWNAIYDQFSERLVDAGAEGLGALDFLDDLKLVLEQERALLDAYDRSVTQPALASTERDWKAIESQVSEVTTSRGTITIVTDFFRLSRIQAAYVAFLNEAEQTVLNKARQDGAKAVYTALIEQIGSLAGRLSRLIHHDIPAAIRVLETKETELHTRLFQETEGQDESVDNIGSVNVITQEWRDTYLQARGLKPIDVLSNLLKRGWHPKELLEISPGKGVTIGAMLAQHVVDRVEPFFEDVRSWTPLDFLKKTEELGRQKPEDLIAQIYLKSLQPQAELSSMTTLLLHKPYSIVFCGGIDEALKAKLESTDAFAGVNLNVADNQETHRINFFQATLPVSPAGVDLLQKTLQEEFNRWWKDLAKLSRKDQAYQKSLFHCFPGSTQWPLPTRFSHEFDEAKEQFARALAVSEMLALDDSDQKRMLSASPNPKEQGYGLFQFGKNQFWLWPFFEPFSNASKLSGKPRRLGSNVLDAYETFARNQEATRDAAAWANWFEANWSQYYTGPQLEERRQLAIDKFQSRKGRAAQPGWIELWDEIVEAVQRWQIG